MVDWFKPVTLEHTHVRLEPLAVRHLEGLCSVGLDASLWEHTVSRIGTKEEMLRYIDEALQNQQRHESLPFAIIDRKDASVAGTTRFGNMDERNRRVEIGWTWLGKRWQRTAFNTEAKYLLLRHAFEVLECVRVEFKTDVNNVQSRQAIERIGAQMEGILRKHMIRENGSFRDTVYYSILDAEWERIRTLLHSKLKTEQSSEMTEPGKDG